MDVTAYKLAERFIGVSEVPGLKDNAMILSMLRLDGGWPEHDEIPWCSAFVNYIAWLLRLPRSKNLAARSWLSVGYTVSPLEEAKVGFDVVVMWRGRPLGPEVRFEDGKYPPGHVGFFAGWDKQHRLVSVLGGNQGNSVSIAQYSMERVIGIRRLA